MSPDRNTASATSPPAPRRFAPVPVETSTRSSKRKQQDEGQKVETQEATSHGETTHIENAEVTASRPRKFVPEPVETTTRTSRRQLPQPEETSSRSTRKNKGEDSDIPQPRRKFVPEPIETSSRRRGGRRTRSLDEAGDQEMVEAPLRQSSMESTSSAGRRKFSPELVETARGSYRRRTPGGGSPEYPRSPVANGFGSESPLGSPKSKLGGANIHQSRFSAANLLKRQEKRHSFMVPELPSIPSDSSGESADETSGATSPSTVSGGLAKTVRTRRSSGEQFAHRLLDLAARVAERQLREVALSAFPNERSYHPVDHYALEDDEEEEEAVKPGTFSAHDNVHVSRFRRDSAADLELELNKMRQHYSDMDKLKEELTTEAEEAGESKFSAAALASKKGISLGKPSETPAKVVGQWQKGLGLTEMKNAARPPMLGEDIIFPFSVSPRTTRCDVDQVPVPRTEEADGDVVMGNTQLWSARIGVEDDKDSGLWMGTCGRNTNASTPHDIRRSGLMTPAVEIDDPFGSVQSKDKQLFMQHLPLTPASSRVDSSVDGIEQMLQMEREIEEEYNDAFVTQIYNYLSLGYPSLAHPFDPELSKISRIPLEELRKDDLRADAKGYVGAPEGKGLGERDVAEGACARWSALKLYIHEWARQQPTMGQRYPDIWGSRVRRGSWAF